MIHYIPAEQALAQLGSFSAIIDARSEGEHAEDHLPGAANWPSLNNEERQRIGTIYKQVSPFEAQKRGAALVAANIARHIERELLDTPKNWQPLIYCWRGGKRSGALAMVLGQIGFKISVVEGGYKAFRTAMLADTAVQATRLSYRVVCGPTGSGKTRLLGALAQAGAQVLDLEALACHRSSVLGLIPGTPQPTQKRFDTLVWDALRKFDAARPVFVESESKKVGNLTVPDALMQAMRASPCFDLQLSDDERVALLLEDYDFFAKDSALFCTRLDALTMLRGKAVVQGWKDKVHAGQTEAVVRDLLLTHYDPGYLGSMQRNFIQYGVATALVAKDRSAAAMARLAHQMVFDGV
ncbi:MAG: tRNA 2-selenouridine(34) synthase MnmH [Pseudomonadota bacterium]